MSLPLEVQSGPETTPPASTPTPAVPVAGLKRSVRLGEWRLLALVLLLFFLRDLPWRLEEFGQAEQAFTSLEMVRAGHWWFQHLPGSVVAATTPPLIGWISAGLYHLTGGEWDLAWRLPSLLAALGVVAVLWLAGERLWPQWGGTLAAGAFAFNFLTPRLAMLVRPDMPLTLMTTLLGLVVWSRVQLKRPWSGDARWLVFWLVLAALMIAGPMVYAVLIPGLVAYRWVTRWRGSQALPGVWGGWWPWTLPLLPFLWWLERGIIKVPGFYQQLLGQPLLGHVAAAGAGDVHPGQPLYFYVLELLVLWAPWSLLLLAVRLRARRIWWQVCAQPATLWLVCWAGGGLLCLTLLPGKEMDRMIPLLPPFCLLLTAVLAAARMPAAEIASAPVAAVAQVWPQNWSRWTLLGAYLLVPAVTAIQIGANYHRHANMLADFGTRVRTLTQPARCELVLTNDPTANDAAMLVYLRRLSYLNPAQAIQLQSTGELDRIVLDDPSARGARALLGRFDTAHPLLVSGGGGMFALVAGAEPSVNKPVKRH